MFQAEKIGLEHIRHVCEQHFIDIEVPKVFLVSQGPLAGKTVSFILMEFVVMRNKQKEDEERFAKQLAWLHLTTTEKRCEFFVNNFNGLNFVDNSWTISWVDLFGRYFKQQLELLKA